MPDSLKGRQILVVGGAGGLGAATSALLAAEGAVLTVTYRANRERAEQLAGIARVVQADITSQEDRGRLLAAMPRLYGLVIFAGHPARAAAPAELPAAMEHSMRVNYLGPVLLAREAAARMREQEIPGSLVLVSTMQAVSVFPGSTAYAGAKSALLQAARILAKECRGAPGIRVNVIAPGVMAAGMAEASIASGKYNRYLEEGVVQRFGRPEDAARAVRFFLEPDNYITGQVLSVDGGITL